MTNCIEFNLPAATTSNTLGWVEDYAWEPAVADGLVGAFLFGADVPLATQNWGSGGAVSIVGAPVWSAQGWARFASGVNYLQTAIAESNDMTIMVVGRSDDTLVDDDHCPWFASTYQGPSVTAPLVTSQGVSLMSLAGNNLQMQGFRGTADGVTTNHGRSGSLGVDFAQFRCLAGVLSGLRSDAYDLTSGTTAGYLHNLPRLRTGNTFRIGSTYGGAGGRCDIAALMLWDRALTLEQLQTQRAELAEIQMRRYARVT